jgi:hypothetical protein
MKFAWQLAFAMVGAAVDFGPVVFAAIVGPDASGAAPH